MPKIIHEKERLIGVNTRFPQEIIQEMDVLAAHLGVTRSVVVRRLVEDALLRGDVDWEEEE